MSTVGVRYKCRCMWLEDIVNPRVFGDHRARSPRCREAKLEYIKLPAPPDGIIGGSDG